MEGSWVVVVSWAWAAGRVATAAGNATATATARARARWLLDLRFLRGDPSLRAERANFVPAGSAWIHWGSAFGGRARHRGDHSLVTRAWTVLERAKTRWPRDSLRNSRDRARHDGCSQTS